MREPVRRYNRDMPARVLVVDKTSATRDSIADALGDRAEVVHATRDHAVAQLRAAAGANQGFEVVLLDGDPPPTPALVRELAAAGAGARVILVAGGSDPIGLATRCGAAEIGRASCRERVYGPV